MPTTETISQEIQLAFAVPLASLGLILFWLAIYILFEDGEEYFDDTFTDGVNTTELTDWDGVLDNVAAQSAWRCITLFAMHIICPAFPMSAAALWAGSFHMTSAFAIDLMGVVMSGVLFAIGFSETVWDDDNGVGIWHVVNATTLLIFTVPRLFQKRDNAQHVLLGRPCYQEYLTNEQELLESTPTAPTATQEGVPDESNNQAADFV